MTEQAPEVDPYEAKARRFIERVDEVMHEVFDVESEHPVIVIGMQFGEMAQDEDTAPCILSSNLPVCLVGQAIHDMHDVAVMQHQAYHAEDGESPMMEMDDEDVPDEVKEFAARLASDLGVDPSQIVFRSSVGTDDLTDEGIAGLIGERFVPAGDEDVPQTVEAAGRDDIADPALDTWDAEGGANTAEAEQQFESGSENEG